MLIVCFGVTIWSPTIPSHLLGLQAGGLNWESDDICKLKEDICEML